MHALRFFRARLHVEVLSVEQSVKSTWSLFSNSVKNFIFSRLTSRVELQELCVKLLYTLYIRSYNILTKPPSLFRALCKRASGLEQSSGVIIGKRYPLLDYPSIVVVKSNAIICRNCHSIVSLMSHFEIHKNNKPYSSMPQSQSIEWVEQKPDNNCQTTRIVTKRFVHFFCPPGMFASS